MISTHQLRCIGCSSRIPGDQAAPDFRCAACGSLFEVVYAWSEIQSEARSAEPPPSPQMRAASVPNPSALRWLWQERRTSSLAIDQSGVWRFREVLPIVRDFGEVPTLREGNTPLYELPRAAKALGIPWCWPNTRA